LWYLACVPQCQLLRVWRCMASPPCRRRMRTSGVGVPCEGDMASKPVSLDTISMATGLGGQIQDEVVLAIGHLFRFPRRR
jgi:hypothetical protein